MPHILLTQIQQLEFCHIYSTPLSFFPFGGLFYLKQIKDNKSLQPYRLQYASPKKKRKEKKKKNISYRTTRYYHTQQNKQ